MADPLHSYPPQMVSLVLLVWSHCPTSRNVQAQARNPPTTTYSNPPAPSYLHPVSAAQDLPRPNTFQTTSLLLVVDLVTPYLHFLLSNTQLHPLLGQTHLHPRLSTKYLPCMVLSSLARPNDRLLAHRPHIWPWICSHTPNPSARHPAAHSSITATHYPFRPLQVLSSFMTRACRLTSSP
jgi:hypothetical protein